MLFRNFHRRALVFVLILFPGLATWLPEHMVHAAGAG